MYYYIFEPPLEAKEYERTTQIKELLSSLGIAGEMTNPTPGRTVEDLVELAVAKRYSTIIAVGNTELINRVARALEPHDVVFGIIPLSENKDISNLIGLADWKSAAEHLKRRRWQPVRIGLINKEIGFITPATINLPTLSNYEIITPDYTLSGQGGTITITPLRGNENDTHSSFLLEMDNEQPVKTGFLSSLFSKPTNIPQKSQLVVTELELRTQESASVIVAGAAVCATPIFCETQGKPLKLIIAKGSSTS